MTHPPIFSRSRAFFYFLPATILPKRAQIGRKSIEQEGRILLAIQTIKNKEFRSIRETVYRFDIPESTLRCRLRGTANRAESCINSYELIQTKEEIFKKWILSMDLYRAVPKSAAVRKIANLLFAKCRTISIKTVGKKWIYNFIQYTPEFQLRFLYRYNYQRTKQKNLKIIQI